MSVRTTDGLSKGLLSAVPLNGESEVGLTTTAAGSSPLAEEFWDEPEQATSVNETNVVAQTTTNALNGKECDTQFRLKLGNFYSVD